MKGQCFARLIVVSAVFLLVSATGTFGESRPSTEFLKLGKDRINGSLRTEMVKRAQEARPRAIFLADVRFNLDLTPQPQSQPTPRNRSIQRKVLGTIIGATA